MTKGIYKRGNTYWIRYAGLDHRTVYESSGSTKFKDAETLLLKRKQSIKEGKQPEIKRIENYSFKQLADEYKKFAKMQRSYKSKEYLVNQLVGDFGSLPLRNFNTLLIEQYQTERRKTGKRKPAVGARKTIEDGNKPATVNRLTATIKHMFTKAVDWNMVEEDILKRIRKVKQLKEENARLRYLTKEECQALVEAADKHVRPILITALNTGMRKTEILTLKWDQVDLSNGFLLLDKTKNGEKREVPINTTLTNTLKSLIRRIDIPYVFYDPSTETHYRDVKRSFATACRKAKIRDFHFHDMRHTFASHLVMAGVDLTTVKELLGHKTLSMTLRYAHLAPSHKVKAVDILDSTINEKSTIQKLYNQASGE